MTDLETLNTREWLSLPEEIREEIIEYVNNGLLERETTLYYALVNDYINTICHASPDLLAAIRELAVCIYNYLPSNCHGNIDTVDYWIQRGGLNGIATESSTAE